MDKAAVEELESKHAALHALIEEEEHRPHPDEDLLHRDFRGTVALDHLRESGEDLRQALGERKRIVGADAPARDIGERGAVLFEHPVARAAEAGIDAEDADGAQPKDAVV